MDKKDESLGKAKNNTLYDFVENNQKIISVLGVFIALTIFTANLSLKAIGYILSFMFLAITIVVWLEILKQIPKENNNWKLNAFGDLLNLSFFGILFYWLISYRDIWKKVMDIPIMIMFIVILSNILIHASNKYKIIEIFYKTRLGNSKYTRFILFAIFLFIVLFVSHWVAIIISPPINYILDQIHDDIIKWIPNNI